MKKTTNKVTREALAAGRAQTKAWKDERKLLASRLKLMTRDLAGLCRMLDRDVHAKAKALALAKRAALAKYRKACAGVEREERKILRRIEILNGRIG